jgi:peptidoglycan/xylan/chitin deacetylase (PgdA/CDA1 family)
MPWIRPLAETQPRLPILTFHTLETGSEPICFSPQGFQHGLHRLHAAGHRCLSLPEAVDCLRQGKPLPEPALVITFDDGYQSVYEEAFPALQRYGLTATVFITVGDQAALRQGPATSAAGTTGPALRPDPRLPSLSGRTMLSWGEIREMRRAGFTFGAHTLTHPDLTGLPIDRMEMEIRSSKAVIEEALGEEIACFAYPYGCYDALSRGIVQEHFVCACSDRLGLVTARSDPYALERVDAYYLRSGRLFGLMATGLFPWYIGACSVPRRLRRAFFGRPG